jgi:hypothetical protein
MLAAINRPDYTGSALFSTGYRTPQDSGGVRVLPGNHQDKPGLMRVELPARKEPSQFTPAQKQR